MNHSIQDILKTIPKKDRQVLEKAIESLTKERDSSEARLKQYQVALEEGIFDWNLQTDQVFYSPEWKRMLGYEPHDWTDSLSEWQDRIHPDDYQATWQALEAITEGLCQRCELEYRMKHRAGHWIDVLCHAKVIPDGKKTSRRIVGGQVDISGQKSTARGLKANEERLWTLINNMSDIACFKDNAGKWLIANDYDLQLFQLAGVDYVGKTDSELAETTPFYREALLTCEDSDNRAWDNNGPFKCEEIIPCPDGSRRVFDITKIPTYTENGERKGLIVHGRDITDMKRRELDIQKSRERLSLALEASKTGILDWEIQSGKVYFDSCFYTLAGYQPDEFPHRFEEWKDRVHPDDRGSFKKALAQYISGESDEFFLEFRFQRKDGEWMWALGKGKITKRTPSGQPLRFTGTHQDITPRKMAEIHLFQEKNKAQLYLDLAGHMFVAINEKGDVSMINREGCRILERSEKDVIGKNWFDTFYPAHAREIAKLNYENLLKEGEGSLNYFENYLLTPSGMEKLIAWHTTLVKDPDKGTLGILSSGEDITEKRKAEQALAASEARYRGFFEKGPDGIVVIDPEKRTFLEFNDQVCRQLGYTREEFSQLDINDLDADESVEQTRTRIQGIIDKGFGKFEVRQKTKQGEIRNIRVTAQVIQIDRKPFYHCIWRDITEQKQSEKALLENQRLNAIGEMATSVAHDFNNALQSIFGNLELAMVNHELPESAMRFLKTVKTASEDAATRVKMLQRFGGKKQDSSTYLPVNLNQIIQEVIQQARPLWKNRAELEGISFSIKTHLADLPDILGNGGELRSVIYNILKNAIEAMPQGGCISLKSFIREKDIVLHVVDQGTGMDSETAQRIFQPFFSTKGFELGRGFGMSGAYAIIKEHGGTLSVLDSGKGTGTTMELSLPIAVKTKTIPKDKIKPRINRKANILWVDDEEAIRDLASYYLESLGHEGDVVSSGQEALDLLEQTQYDLVITDIGMKGMNGWQLAEKIRDRFGKALKVAVITGWGAQIDPEKKAQYSVGYVLGKPINLQDLTNLIDEALVS